MDTKCLDNLGWFICKSKKDHWHLSYDKSLPIETFGVIEYDEDTFSYKFIPVLHGGLRVYGVIVKNKLIKRRRKHDFNTR